MTLGIDWFNVYTVTQAEFEANFDAVLEKICNGSSPALIVCENRQRIAIFEWEDYWHRVGALLPPGEKERVEAECMCVYKESGDQGRFSHQEEDISC